MKKSNTKTKTSPPRKGVAPLRLQHIGTAYRSHASAAARLARVGLAPRDLRTDQGRGFQLDSRTLLGNECWLHVVHNWNPEARVCQYAHTVGEGLEHLAIEFDDVEAAVERVRAPRPDLRRPDHPRRRRLRGLRHPRGRLRLHGRADPAAPDQLELARPTAGAHEPAALRQTPHRSSGVGGGSGRRLGPLPRALRRHRERPPASWPSPIAATSASRSRHPIRGSAGGCTRWCSRRPIRERISARFRPPGSLRNGRRAGRSRSRRALPGSGSCCRPSDGAARSNRLSPGTY